MERLKRNIKGYYLYTIFSDLLIIGPIIMVYMLSKGLSFTQIMLINSISCIAVVIFEVPTGAISDKLGRKISMIIGPALWGISLTMYIFGKGFYSLALAEIVFALGMTFKSGSDIALIYDSLKAIGREDEFQRIEGKAKAYLLYAQAVGSLAAGFLYKYNKDLPIIVSIIFMIITIVISFTLYEPPIEDKKGQYGEKYLKQIYESGKYVLNHEKLKAIILFLMVFYVFYREGFFLFQPYFEDVHIPVEYFGIIFFVFNIVAGLVSNRSHKIIAITKRRSLMFLSSLMIVSFTILGLTKIWIGVFAMLLQQMARGLYGPTTRKYLNKYIPSNKRATILSFVSLLTNLAGAVSYPLLGLIKDKTTIFNTHLILAAIMFVLTFLTSIYMNKRMGHFNKGIISKDEKNYTPGV
ncbi:putative sialic acid transporter [Clostridium tepidiprofundi DSM 19306]|uniref:Putative sialic acid transporter n=1 Tax=Clostridium tepidiprofundi DSM 19306 TaxID=1121338 RepID=A0A151B4X3_9CLOT|nr:MFS transporter [Clostridium tepidiprofundi]KYH34707.1 putative sialic acid transporter [Clostridium tepidiprofundi DSM 19306]